MRMERAARTEGLEYAQCSRCMCLIEAFTRSDAFPVPQFTLVFSSQVSKENVCSCVDVALK